MEQRKNLLAIEIGERELKMGYLKVKHGKGNIISLARFDINEGQEEALSGEIQRFAKRERIKKPSVINVISSNFAISKNIEIPSVDRKEIKDIINLQAGRHTPYSREEIIMDYTEIGVFHNRYTKVLLVIVRREIVEKRYNVIKKAGFNIDRTVLASEGIAALCFSLGKDKLEDKPLGILHIDREYSDFIVGQKKCIYTRSIPIGAVNILSDSGEAKENFLQEVRRSLEAYQTENISVFPGIFYFTGAFSFLASQMKEEVKKVLNITTAQDLFYYKTLNFSPEIIKEIQESKYTSFLSIIASLIHIDDLQLDLVPDDIKIKREVRKQAKRIIQMGILFMAILFAFCATLLTNLFFKKLYLKKILSSYTQEIQEAKQLKEISQRKEIIRRLIGNKKRALLVLTELLKFISKEIYLNSVRVQEDGTIVLTATANTMSRVFSFVTELENSEFFKNVKVDFTKTRRFKNKEVADFGLTFMWEKDFYSSKPH